MGDIDKKADERLWQRRHRRPQSYRPGPFAAIYSGLLAAGLVAAAAVYYVLVHHVPGMAKDPADTVKIALLVIGGSGALAGLYVSYRKQRTDEANHVRDQDKLFTERYTQAVAQLGNSAAAVRLGGVYALARIADDSERDRPTCLKVLCGYLRMPYDPEDPETEPAERQVRTTVQDVLADRLVPGHPGFWSNALINLDGAHLIDVAFNKIVVHVFSARGATFSGGAIFDQATFENGFFIRATFNGYTRFYKAVFIEKGVFDRSVFTRHTLFTEAAFSGLTATYTGALFRGDTTRFDGVTFNVRHLSFAGATFCRDRPPIWPAEFDEPAGIVWDSADPPTPVRDPNPDPLTDAADLPAGP